MSKCHWKPAEQEKNGPVDHCHLQEGDRLHNTTRFKQIHFYVLHVYGMDYIYYFGWKLLESIIYNIKQDYCIYHPYTCQFWGHYCGTKKYILITAIFLREAWLSLSDKDHSFQPKRLIKLLPWPRDWRHCHHKQTEAQCLPHMNWKITGNQLDTPPPHPGPVTTP